MHSDYGGAVNTMKKLLALGLAATMVFTNSILAGDTLVRDSIQSEGYVAGSNGWSINRDGTAEFNDVTSRGELIVGDLATKYISITNTPQPVINLGTPSNAEETLPASIQELATGFSSYLFMNSPERNSSGNDATISLIATDDPKTQFAVSADESYLQSSFIQLGDSGTDQHLNLLYNAGDGNAELRNPDEVWKDKSVTALAGTWVDVAGSRFAYYKDATGRVQVRGKVSGGGAGATIVTLPVGYRPSSNLEFTMRAAVGVIASVSVSTGGVLTVTTNLASASANGIFLDVISFPTF